jgi:hypothetical protein
MAFTALQFSDTVASVIGGGTHHRCDAAREGGTSNNVGPSLAIPVGRPGSLLDRRTDTVRVSLGGHVP